ncbi:hypothetical protein HCR_21430 [Hydrogenimonas cancrithermarum]|uniref:Uncharacterized protein n=1 Tax=Hydrogenimonas cancrithermarum TaxID=2993563 RepID=A0ABM8FN54_9BACT|nr:hypothetical protein HCR_21430 [Hydrogenimonas cancrithermarum]
MIKSDSEYRPQSVTQHIFLSIPNIALGTEKRYTRLIIGHYCEPPLNNLIQSRHTQNSENPE